MSNQYFLESISSGDPKKDYQAMLKVLLADQESGSQKVFMGSKIKTCPYCKMAIGESEHLCPYCGAPQNEVAFSSPAYFDPRYNKEYIHPEFSEDRIDELEERSRADEANIMNLREHFLHLDHVYGLRMDELESKLHAHVFAIIMAITFALAGIVLYYLK